MRTLLSFLLLLAGAVTASGQQPGEMTADALAQAVQAHYEKVRDFSADFVHSYEGGVLRKKVTERGKVLIKKPGRMRWTYTDPERKEFVSDGSKLYSYIPEDKQVIVGSVEPGDGADTPALFLSGKGNILRDFGASLISVPEATAGTAALRLVPIRPQQEYDWLVLVVDRRTYQIRSLISTDRQGGRSAFTFTNLRENVGLADSAFTFRIPSGVDIVTQEPRK